MNRDEAKTILLLYRPGTADAAEPEIAEALALAKRDPELARWLEEHCARQEALRAKFRQIAVPLGLKEQIISEQQVFVRRKIRRRMLVTAAATAIIAMSLVVLATFWLPRHSLPADNTLANYENRMVRVALSGYFMDLTTNDPAQIRAYLAQRQAPADYVLPAGLQKATVTGCAIEGWQNTKAAMICFRTGKPLPSGQQSDLWLFVVNRASVKNAPPPGPPQIKPVNQLITAVWTQGDRVYFLGTEGDAQTLQQFL